LEEVSRGGGVFEALGGGQLQVEKVIVENDVDCRWEQLGCHCTVIVQIHCTTHLTTFLAFVHPVQVTLPR